MSNYIQEKSRRLNIPVISFVEDEAVSCGYWLACTAQKIFACRTSNIGGRVRHSHWSGSLQILSSDWFT